MHKTTNTTTKYIFSENDVINMIDAFLLKHEEGGEINFMNAVVRARSANSSNASVPVGQLELTIYGSPCSKAGESGSKPD